MLKGVGIIIRGVPLYDQHSSVLPRQQNIYMPMNSWCKIQRCNATKVIVTGVWMKVGNSGVGRCFVMEGGGGGGGHEVAECKERSRSGRIFGTSFSTIRKPMQLS